MTHQLTEAQQAAVRPYIDARKELERKYNEITERLSWFLQYVISENKLDGNWSLSEDGTALTRTDTTPEQNISPIEENTNG